jgi:hypothetical protein
MKRVTIELSERELFALLAHNGIVPEYRDHDYIVEKVRYASAGGGRFGGARRRSTVRALEKLAAVAFDKAKCQICGAGATCYGTYEKKTGYGCDDCCGHGCEDGDCFQLRPS